MEVAQLACAAAFCKNSAVKDIMNKEGSNEAVPHLDIFSWIGWAFIKSKSEISWGNISVFFPWNLFCMFVGHSCCRDLACSLMNSNSLVKSSQWLSFWPILFLQCQQSPSSRGFFFQTSMSWGASNGRVFHTVVDEMGWSQSLIPVSIENVLEGASAVQHGPLDTFYGA